MSEKSMRVRILARHECTVENIQGKMQHLLDMGGKAAKRDTETT